MVDYDCIIQGGGIVGASLALMLGQQQYRVLLIEKNAATLATDDFNARTLALSYASYQIFSALSIWEKLSKRAVPISQVKVSMQGQFGTARLLTQDPTLPLGYVVGFHALEQALYSALADNPLVQVQRLTTIRESLNHSDHWEVELDNGLKQRARLLVAADGANSLLGLKQSITMHQTHYGHAALVTNIQLNHRSGVAIERFLAQGAIALLPWQNNYFTLVWTMAEKDQARLVAMSDKEFLQECQQALGYRMGIIERCSARHYFPLTMQLAATQHSARLLLMGNAAHQLHPIAAQGLNLSLRDAWQLRSQLLHHAQHDIGDSQLLKAYVNARSNAQAKVIMGTDGIAKFLSDGPLPPWLRALGITLFDMLSPLKQKFTHINMGFS